MRDGSKNAHLYVSNSLMRFYQMDALLLEQSQQEEEKKKNQEEEEEESADCAEGNQTGS